MTSKQQLIRDSDFDIEQKEEINELEEDRWINTQINASKSINC